MGILNKTNAFTKRFKDDVSGNMAMAWGVCMTAVIMTSGAAFDVHQHAKAKMLAQLAADNMALAASIAVDTDNTDKYVEGQWYTYKNIGGPSEDFTKSIKGKVAYNVDDDGDGVGNLLARATVKGTYKPAFFPVVGKAKMVFSASSDVAYAQKATTPASILLVLDNSGSMAWDDDDGENKINGLKTTVNGFMTTLDSLTAGQTPRVLRTGMLSYSSAWQTKTVEVCGQRQVWVWDTYGHWEYSGRGRRARRRWVSGTGHYEMQDQCWDENQNVTDGDAIFFNNTVTMDWGVVPTGNITDMYAHGGTDPSGALTEAKSWMSDEEVKHTAENGIKNPLKFVIFMTDGSNNSHSITTTSQARCKQMKDKGVIIYTVGYDLDAGRQYEDGSYTGYKVTQSEVNEAQAFLKNCATDNDHYILASGADDLNDVFQSIGQEIVNEVIRIKS